MANIKINSTYSLLMVGVVLISVSQPLLAQDDSDAFIETMQQNISVIQNSSTTTMQSNDVPRVSAGYFQVAIEKLDGSSSTASSDVNREACEEAVKKFGGNQFLDFVFKSKTDFGLSVQLPVKAWAGNYNEALNDYTSSVNLFRFFSSGGRKCNIEHGFARDSATTTYQTPMVPIDHSYGAQDLVAPIKFIPWFVKEQNQSRVDAFWTSLGSLAKLVVPYGSILSAGSGNTDLVGQAKSSILDLDDVEKEAEWVNKDVKISLNSTPDDDKFFGNHLTFNWKIEGSSSQNKQYIEEIKYKISIRYTGSRFLAGDKFPDLSGYVKSNFNTNILNANADLGSNKTIINLVASAENLLDAKTTEAYNASCSPLFGEMERLGYSRSDQALVVYGIAMQRTGPEASNWTQRDIWNLRCVSESKIDLARFNIVPPDFGLTASRLDHWQSVSKSFQNAFQASQFIGQASSLNNFANLFAPTVLVGGDTKLLGNSDGGTIALTSAIFVDGLKNAKLLASSFEDNQSCNIFDRSNGGESKAIKFAGKGLPRSTDRSIGQLVKMGDDIRLLVLGFKGLDKIGKPIIESVWISPKNHIDDFGENPFIDQMKIKAECKANIWSSFFAEKKVPDGGSDEAI